MIKTIAIYPAEKMNQSLADKWDKYISLAKEYGFNEVFSTMHLPELDLTTQIDCVVTIAELAQKHHMGFMIDIGGPFITQILENSSALERIKKIKIDFIRLDYGYNQQQIKELFDKLNIKGFVINASTYNQQQIEKEIAFFNSLPDCELRACHNFYPREETGLTKEFALKQDSFFSKYDLVTYYMIPSHTNPRGPIFKGLPTIEDHRYKDIVSIALDLINNYNVQAIMLADEFFSEEELSCLKNAIEGEIITIRCQVDDSYKDLVLKKHIFRYDSYPKCLRSKSSRQMAEFAQEIEPDNTIVRKKGAITIDNRNYQRYSGEVQIVMVDLPKDERVNVIGEVNPEDLEKLNYYQYGYVYEFVEKK